MKHGEVRLEESLIVLMSKINEMFEVGYSDKCVVDVILGEIRACLEYNKVKLPEGALQDLTYDSQYKYEEV